MIGVWHAGYTPGGMIMRNVYVILERWGNWARDTNNLNYSSIAAGFKGTMFDSNNGALVCCDDDGLVIDGCMSRLKKHKPDEFEIIVSHHIYGFSLRKIARNRKCSDGTIRKKMQTAEGFIDGCLAILDIKLNCE